MQLGRPILTEDLVVRAQTCLHDLVLTTLQCILWASGYSKSDICRFNRAPFPPPSLALCGYGKLGRAQD